VLCLQETKVEDDLFPVDDFTYLGYREAIWGQKTYNGVAILSKKPIEAVVRVFDGKGNEEQKRLIAATISGIRVVNAYIPNGGDVGSDKFAYKLEFIGQLREYFAKQHKPTEPLVFVGDFNVATEPIDVFDPKEMEGQTCFHPDERAALAKVFAWGFQDQFRRFEKGDKHYTWWDYRGAGWQRGRGLRIDHIWTTEPLAKRGKACTIDREARAKEKASDHVPVTATFTV
jgi:exodeoxyribonuclease-3